MGPDEICKERARGWSERLTRSKNRHRLLGNARLVGSVLGLVFLWWVESNAPAFTWLTVSVLVGAFMATTAVFSRFEKASKYATLAKILYLTHAPGETRNGIGNQSAEDLEFNKDHPFAFDTDIVESGGLVDYLNIATTREGIDRLAGLLTVYASKNLIEQRQAAVKELKAQLDLREEMFVVGSMKRTYIRTEQMRHWAEQDVAKVPKWVPATCVAFSCSVLAFIGAVAYSPSAATYVALASALVAQFAFAKVCRRYLKAEGMNAERIHLDFDSLRGLVEILERQKFQAPILRDLIGCLQSANGERASRTIGRFCRLISSYEARRNQIVAVLGPLVMYEIQLALAIERWRAKHGAKVPAWIDAVGTFEAYSALGCFAFENPYYCFARLSDTGPVLQAESLAHPLLGEDAVANDISLDAQRPILVVSGANMAGKSTLLRTIGASVALTYAGAPVRARSLKMSIVNAVASIRVQDSLQGGVSKFAAELQRIRLMLESIRGGIPTLVLVDELFAGTNSFDRFTGAVALSKFLLACETSLAVLSTHDRNVTHWAEHNSDRVSNVHFRDIFEDGKMRFDFKLKAGPALRGNAVDLMKLAGLPIPDTLPTAYG